MTERDFVYWLQGFFELTDSNELKVAQVEMIKEHLALVLKKETNSIEELEKPHAESLEEKVVIDIEPSNIPNWTRPWNHDTKAC